MVVVLSVKNYIKILNSNLGFQEHSWMYQRNNPYADCNVLSAGTELCLLTWTLIP